MLADMVKAGTLPPVEERLLGYQVIEVIRLHRQVRRHDERCRDWR